MQMPHLVYSSSLKAFTERAQAILSDIITFETKLRLEKRRFVVGRNLYPIKIVTFENFAQLAYFEPLQLHIGLHRKLAFHAGQKELQNILRHELAHYLTWIWYGPDILAHGQEFKQTCQRFGWDESVSHATMPEQELAGLDPDAKHLALIVKIKKLLALATSDNPEEALAAERMANKLILKHNLDWINTDSADQNSNFETYTMVVLQGKKVSAKERAISQMLKCFFVETVFCYGQGGFALEVVGAKHNMHLANHVAKFLINHLDYLWQLEKTLHEGMKGLRARNSFFLGLADGFEQKYKSAQKNVEQEIGELNGSLILIENLLERHFKQAHPRLTSGRYQCALDEFARERGHDVGQKLGIHPPVENGSRGLLLT